MSGLFADPTNGVIVVLLVLRVLMSVVTTESQSGLLKVDVARFHQLAATDGRPYRDHVVEYAPAETIAIELVAGGSLRGTAIRLAALAFICDVLAFAGLWYGWGRRPAALYLLIGLPLVPFIYARLDLLVVALAVWGSAFARRGRERLGGGVLALAAMTKLWPLVVAPVLLVDRRARAARWFACLVGVGFLAWVAYGGVDAIRQVVSFRGATGWEIESTVGAIVWLITGGPVRTEEGAPRVGEVPGWSRALLLLVLLAVLAAIWARAWKRQVDPSGAPSLAALAALLALSPLFSLQYALWIAPWAAIAWVDARTARYGRVGFAITLLTGTLAFFYVVPWDTGDAPIPLVRWLVIGLLLVRDGLCVWIAVAWFRRDPSLDPTPA
ncbi:MAG: glycosyltransferase 87 family protein [Actinomycetota bacterium]